MLSPRGQSQNRGRCDTDRRRRDDFGPRRYDFCSRHLIETIENKVPRAVPGARDGFKPTRRPTIPVICMSDNHAQPDAPLESEQEFEWDLDAEWAQARAQTERADAKLAATQPEPPPAEISVYALLYTGFLLGPAASLLGVLILMGRRFRLRTVIFALGVCGASWCIAQGVTFGLRSSWTPATLQMLRTLLNFGAGVILLGFIRAKTDIYLLHDRKVWLNTGVFFLLLFLISLSLSPELLFWLGR